MMVERDRWLAGHITDAEFNERPRREYDIADSVHRGDAFEVYDIEAGAVTIVRRVDGAERFLQPEDGEKLVSELDLFGAVFDDNAAYVEHADKHLSEYFTE